MPAPIKIDRAWKKTIELEPKAPFCSLVSMWDLLFYYDKVLEVWRPRFRSDATNEKYRMMGLPLSHTTIVLDEWMYGPADPPTTAHRTLDQDQVQFTDWAIRGFDIVLPRFDTRAKPLFLTTKNVGDYIKPTTMVSVANLQSELTGIINAIDPILEQDDLFYPLGKGLKVWPKNSLMMPSNTYEAYTNSAFDEMAVHSESNANTWIDCPVPLTIGAENDGIVSIEGANLILTQKDEKFIEKYHLPDDRTAWDGVLLNYTVQSSFLPAYRYFGYDGLAKDIDSAKWLGAVTSLEANFSTSLVARWLLENCFVYVKCAFYADYIDFRDFNQKLDQKSDVVHNNVVVSKVGDHVPFDKVAGADVDVGETQKTSRPYIAKSVPTYDILTRETLGTEYQPKNVGSTVKALMRRGQDPNDVIGALYNEPFEMSSKVEGVTPATDDITPPMFFDPNSRKDPDTVVNGKSLYTDIPVVVPRSGNLVVDGRITSPTIDELWAMIKAMAAGRAPDSGGDSVSSGVHGAYPKGTGEKSSLVDTRVKMREFRFNSGTGYAIGDPMEINYVWSVDSTKTPSGYAVNKWVNDPSEIQYAIIEELKAFNESLCSINGPWPPFTNNALASLQKVTEYAASQTVMSLRELEAIVKGLRYNFVYLIEVLLRDYVVSGSLGRPNEDVGRPGDDANKVGGSVYMLHRDSYGSDTIGTGRTPHYTVYDERLNPRSIKDSNYNAQNVPAIIHGRGLGTLTKRDFPISDPWALPSWAVYMGADGRWHSSGQALIIPVISTERL